MADVPTLNFWQRNQVFISGLAGALLLVLQQFATNAETSIDYKALGLAALVAVGGYLGNTLRGKGVTIGGFVGVVGTAIATIESTGHFTWAQFGIAVTIGFLAIIAPPAKPATYETSEEIVKAKEIPPKEQVVDDSKLPIGTIPATTPNKP